MVGDSDAYNHMKKLQQSFEALKSPVLPRACAVAQELISIENEADRWDLIAAAWAEMLYYTAARCGGGFHYDHLSTGGEFATHACSRSHVFTWSFPTASLPVDPSDFIDPKHRS